MDIKEYEIKGKHKDTGHKRTIKVYAVTLERSKYIAGEKGLIEPYEIIELPPQIPTERQLAYAKDLGISIPENATFYEISDLISREIDNDNSDPSIGFIDFANAREMSFSKYIGKKALYNLTFNELSDFEKISFFIFCVYRWLSDDRDSNLDFHKYRDKIYEIANKLFHDERFIKSLNRYDGEEIRFFGEITNTNGEVFNGGSTETIAYKTVSEILCKEFNLKNRKFKILQSSNTHKDSVVDFHHSKPNKNGCLSIVIFVMTIYVFLFFIFKNVFHF